MEAPLWEHQQKMGDCPLQWLISDLQHPMRISTHEKTPFHGEDRPPFPCKKWCLVHLGLTFGWLGEIFMMSAS